MSQSNNKLTVIDDEESSLGRMIRPEASVSTAIALASAMIDKRIATARQWPRSVARFKQEAGDLLREDVETARSAEYAKPVGGSVVKGPSIRLVEIAAMCWGNLEVEVGDPVITDKSVVVKAVAYDLERNYRAEGMSTTSILKRDGTRYPQHMIETATLATAAKARRGAIENVIPKAYIKDLLEVAKKVAAGSEKPLEQRRQDMLDYFARTYKVQPDQIFGVLAVGGIDDMTGEHLDDLRTIATSIKDKEATVEEFFPVKAESKTAAVMEKLNARKESTKPKDKADEPDAAKKGTVIEADQLPGLIIAFEESGGDWFEFMGKHGAEKMDDIQKSAGADRAKWVERFEAAIKAMPKKK